MKKSILSLILLLPLPVIGHDYYSSYRVNEKCYGQIYREKYIPGNIRKPGYVRKWEETIRIPCKDHELSIKNESINRNDLQKRITNNLKDIGKWINSKIADWKQNQSDNFLKEK